MSKLRFIKRDGQMILQQHFTAEEFVAAGADFVHHHGWADVPVVEEPSYILARAYMENGALHITRAEAGSDGDVRLIDERLVNKLVEALCHYTVMIPTNGAHVPTGIVSRERATVALAEYRKHVK